MFFKISVLKILPKSTGKQTRKETLERDSNTGVFLWIFEIFENIFFTEHLRKTASLMYWCNVYMQKQPPEVFYIKKVFLKISQNSKENTCARDFFNKEPTSQVFSYDFCEIFKSTF